MNNANVDQCIRTKRNPRNAYQIIEGMAKTDLMVIFTYLASGPILD